MGIVVLLLPACQKCLWVAHMLSAVAWRGTQDLRAAAAYGAAVSLFTTNYFGVVNV